MSASLRTRDGSPSVAGAILASERATGRHAQIDMEGALDWARANKVDLRRVRQPLDRINARRVEMKLPQFRVRSGETRRIAPLPPHRAKVAAPRKLGTPVVASEDALLDLIANHTGTVTGLVTPEIAGWLLDLNTGNRPLNQKAVERFRKILARGGWVNTGEPVIVSREGILNDGQHRLTAIRTSGIPAEIDMRVGIDRAAFHATGTGRRRTAGNVLSIEGYSNTSCQASIARLLYHYDNGQMSQHRAQVEIADILRLIEADDRICEIAAKIQRSKFKPTRTGPFGFVLVVAARTAPLDRVFEFADLVSSGVIHDETDPARRLHVRLRDAAMKKEPLGQLDPAILTAKAWNGWVEGQGVPFFRVIEGDRTSEGFPKIREWPEGGRHQAAAVADSAETIAAA